MRARKINLALHQQRLENLLGSITATIPVELNLMARIDSVVI
jgi:hypothetical protein